MEAIFKPREVALCQCRSLLIVACSWNQVTRTEWPCFATNAGKIEFLQQILSHPCYGDPCHTFSDAEREIIKRLRRTDVLGLYQKRLSVEQDAADRAELARLMAKYGQDTPAVDPGILRTVLLPMNRLDTARIVRRRDDNGQLALGFG